MTKEELLAIGLSEEQIPQIFAINGKDVEKAKTELTTKETELASLKEQLVAANTQIESFKDLNVDEIKAKSEEYKQKFEQTQADAEKKMAELQFEHELENAIRDSKARNTKAVKALLDIETLKSSTDRKQDIKAALEQTKASNDYLFEGEQSLGTGGSLGNGGKAKIAPISKEQFNNMNYNERVELKTTNADLYNELVK